MNLIALDFSSLSAEEKRDLIYTLAESLEETTKTFSFTQKILVQALFVARSCHFYEEIFERLSIPIPTLYQDVMKHLWLYLTDDIDIKQLEEFYQATDSVFTCLLTGDDEFLDENAWDKYSNEWNSAYCGFFLEDAVAPDYILEQIVSNEITWYELPDNQLLCSIGDYICDCALEPVFKIESGGYTYTELQRHDADVYGSSAFASIFALLQEDIRLVADLKDPTKQDILKLQKEYQSKGLFDPLQVMQIADHLKEFYKDSLTAVTE